MLEGKAKIEREFIGAGLRVLVLRIIDVIGLIS